jgi:UDP-glucose-4-epimerase GalE
MSRTALVIGGAGYIGSQTVKALRRAGWFVRVLDIADPPERMWKLAPIVCGDVLDPAMLDAMLDAHTDVVVHLAALTSVAEAVEDPAIYHRTNALGTLNVLDAMRRHGVDKIVFSSSAAVYGHLPTDELVEDYIPAPLNAYGASKWAAELMLRDYSRAYGLRAVALRYFNAAGADPEGDLGEEHDPETHAIPLAMRAALGDDKAAFTVHGDGNGERDYVHVHDVARANVLAADHLLRDGASVTLNIGSGKGRSVWDVVAAVERVSRRKVPIWMGAARPDDPRRLVASIKRARDVLGWEPRLDFDEIIRTAWAWHAKPELVSSR